MPSNLDNPGPREVSDPHDTSAAAGASEEQHDHHCRITFNYQNWWIREVDGYVLVLTNENGVSYCDTSAVDWEAYCDAAVSWDAVNIRSYASAVQS